MRWEDKWKVEKIHATSYRDGTCSILSIEPIIKNGKTIGNDLKEIKGPIPFNVKNIRTTDEEWAMQLEQTIDIKLVIPGIDHFRGRPKDPIVIKIEDNLYRILKSDENRSDKQTYLYLQYRSALGGIKK